VTGSPFRIRVTNSISAKVPILVAVKDYIMDKKTTARKETAPVKTAKPRPSRKKALVAAKKRSFPAKTTPTKTAKAKKPAKQKKAHKKKKPTVSKELMAQAFPMVSKIAEQVHTCIPPELTDRVSSAKNKKHIIAPTFPYDRVMKGSDYESQMELLQIELVKMQAWVKQTGERIVMVFEGRDAAGKGGTIKRFTENLNPRGARVIALAKPSETELGQWYFQRYVSQMPTKGELTFFDRSWYNRAGVEHVMGFCSPHDYLEFMRQAPEFERMLVRSGIRLIKFWFSVSREEQLRRFLWRADDPLKQWKLSPMDIESLGRWDGYTEAKEAMLFYTDTADAPWTIVRSDDKKRARLNAIKIMLKNLPYSAKDESLLEDIDPLIVGAADDIYEFGEHTPAPLGG